MRILLAAPLVALAFAALSAHAQALRSPTPAVVPAPVKPTVVASGLERPWGLAFLPDGRMLVTERPGRLRLVDRDGKVSAPLAGVPGVHAQGQGGLLDVAISADVAKDRMVYLSFSEAGDGGAGTAVARGRLSASGDALEATTVIWRQVPKARGSNNHFGSRLVFARDGTLFVTTGDRQDQRPRVQDLSTTIGKVVRINPDGSVPADNPYARQPGARPELWSIGHRNLQGATLDSAGRLWTVEHGPRGGDELNRPEPGKNYGWPVISYGVEYSGLKIGDGLREKAGMEQPVYYWDPVIAPSGATFYTGDAYRGWKDSLFIGSLDPGALVRLELQGDKVVREERYLGDVGRVRDVVQGPDGLLYLLIDDRNGSIVRVDAASR